MTTTIIWWLVGLVLSLGLLALFFAGVAGAIPPVPGVSAGEGIGIVAIIMFAIAIIIFIASLYFIVKKNASGRITLTELSFLSRSSGALTSILVAYLPLALMWLGPILYMFLLDVSFMYPTIICIITFFLVSTFERVAFPSFESSTLSNYSGVLNKITSP